MNWPYSLLSNFVKDWPPQMCQTEQASGTKTKGNNNHEIDLSRKRRRSTASHCNDSEANLHQIKPAMKSHKVAVIHLKDNLVIARLWLLWWHHFADDVVFLSSSNVSIHAKKFWNYCSELASCFSSLCTCTQEATNVEQNQWSPGNAKTKNTLPYYKIIMLKGQKHKSFDILPMKFLICHKTSTFCTSARLILKHVWLPIGANIEHYFLTNLTKWNLMKFSYSIVVDTITYFLLWIHYPWK